jgi:hypothetical protein
MDYSYTYYALPNLTLSVAQQEQESKPLILCSLLHNKGKRAG